MAQGHDQLRGLDAAPGHHVLRGLGGQFHLLLRAEQDHVGQGSLHGVAHAALALGAARGRGGEDRRLRLGGIFFFRAGHGHLHGAVMHLLATQVAHVRGVHLQLPGERAAQRLVRGDQGLEALVDLPVLALAPFLDGLHEHQARAHHDQGGHQQAHERGQQGGPGTEVEQVAHAES